MKVDDETNCSGIPYPANIFVNISSVAVAVALDLQITATKNIDNWK